MAETSDLSSQLEAISDDSFRTFAQSDIYADLYNKLIIKNREIALLRAQIGYDLNEEEIPSRTLSVNGGRVTSERPSDLLWYKSLANLDINLWTLVSSVLLLWLIFRPQSKPIHAIEAGQRLDYSSLSEAGIGESDTPLDFESKLDLARALMDVGDSDGARRILEGVMISASSDHRNEAASMLDSLAN
jgi:FimV-like protein